MNNTLKNLNISLVSNLILSVIVIIIGIITTVFKSFGLADIVLYASILFYVFAFFSIIAYFVKRNKGDYETLLLSLINIITATVMFVLKGQDELMVLGLGMTLYTIMMLFNRMYKIICLKSENSFMWIVKFVTTFLIGVLGVLTAYNLFNEVSVQTLLYGYYFITLGVIMTLENTIDLVVTDDKFDKAMKKVIAEEDSKNKLEEIKEEKVVKEEKNVKEVKTAKPKKEVKDKAEAKEEKKVVKKLAAKKPEVKKATTKKVAVKKETKKPVQKETTEKRKPGRPKKIK